MRLSAHWQLVEPMGQPNLVKRIQDRGQNVGSKRSTSRTKHVLQEHGGLQPRFGGVIQFGVNCVGRLRFAHFPNGWHRWWGHKTEGEA